MQERINIWGKPGCKLPNGKLCNACCVLPNIELAGVYVSVGKPENSPCPNLSESGVSGGCSLHSGGKPEACESWHCSMADTDGKIDLIAQGLSLDLVSETEAVSSALDLAEGNSSNNTDFSVYIKNKILSKAIIFSEITHPKELIVRDLEEP